MQTKELEILVATMNGAFFERTFECNAPMLVINQTTNDGCPAARSRDMLRIHTFCERGLSRSRNRALSLTKGVVCLIADDDITLLPEFKDRVLSAFEAEPDADIITFQVLTPDGEPFKNNYGAKRRWHDIFSVMRVCSIEVAFRPASVARAGVRFDERFGLGAAFPSGEEGIFLADAIRCGLKVRYVPVPIVVHAKESSGGNFAGNARLIEAKGAIFWRVFGIWSLPISVAFAFRKHRDAEMGFLEFLGHMFNGMRGFYALHMKQGSWGSAVG
jgi:glycosyltransferase involved in cell wall biosynthesis